MKDRIKEFIDYKGISAGELAEMLDVQRSNISHILNGRNKPGAVFLERFLLTFPEINARWLLTGNGNMTGAMKDISGVTSRTDKTTEEVSNPMLQVNNPEVRNEDIVKVILLYTDGSFSSYTPR